MERGWTSIRVWEHEEVALVAARIVRVVTEAARAAEGQR